MTLEHLKKQCALKITALTLFTAYGFYVLYTYFQEAQKNKLEALISKNKQLVEKCSDLTAAAEILKSRALDSCVPVAHDTSSFFPSQVPIILILKVVAVVGACVYVSHVLNSGALITHLHGLSCSLGLSRSETTLSGIDCSNNALILKQDFLLGHGEKGVALFFGETEQFIDVGRLLADSNGLAIAQKAYEVSFIKASQSISKINTYEETLAAQEKIINEKLTEISELQQQITSLETLIADFQTPLLGVGMDPQHLSDLAFGLLG
jgi:hypothetical protein